MKRCIFCGSTKANQFETKEHIVSESLGGKEILPEGLVCDKCNRYFGKAFEKEALDSEKIKFLRALERIPSKRGRIPVAAGEKGEIFVDGNTEPKIIPNSPGQGDKKIISIPSIPSKKAIVSFKFPPSHPGHLLRMLLKIGLEYLAIEQSENMFDPQFSKAKKVVRSPTPGWKWPLAIKTRNYDELTDHKFYRMDDYNSTIFGFSHFTIDPLIEFLIPLTDEDFGKFQLEVRRIDPKCACLNVDIL
jgi:hypothetical protein